MPTQFDLDKDCPYPVEGEDWEFYQASDDDGKPAEIYLEVRSNFNYQAWNGGARIELPDEIVAAILAARKAGLI